MHLRAVLQRLREYKLYVNVNVNVNNLLAISI